MPFLSDSPEKFPVSHYPILQMREQGPVVEMSSVILGAPGFLMTFITRVGYGVGVVFAST